MASYYFFWLKSAIILMIRIKLLILENANT